MSHHSYQHIECHHHSANRVESEQPFSSLLGYFKSVIISVKNVQVDLVEQRPEHALR